MFAAKPACPGHAPDRQARNLDKSPDFHYTFQMKPIFETPFRGGCLDRPKSDFLSILLMLTAMLIGLNVIAADLPEKALSQEAIKALRKEAAQRPRRIIFDNDGNEVVYYMAEATPEALLKKRTIGVVGTQVDTIVYCTWSSGFSYFTHNTKVGVPFVTTAEEPGKGPGSGFSKNKAQALFDKGLDPLTIVADFCSENDIELFWSMRMNDVHDAWGAWYSPHLFPPIKKEHPEYLIGSKKNVPPNGTWSSVDYAVPEIRDLAFKFFEEVCQNYDVDGVELDFFRHPVYFKSYAFDGKASQAELDMMTSLLRRIRAMAEEEGAKRGKPILITVRVPDSVEYCTAMGLDIERWLKEDLVDLMVVSGYFRLNPWEESVALGHKYGVPVYPCLSESRIRDVEAKQIRATNNAYRGRAMDVWNSGADGVYMFNFFAAPHPLWSELGDLEALQKMDKDYTTGSRGIKELNYWNKAGQDYMNREHLSPENPRTVKPGEPATASLRLDIPAENTTVTLKLRCPQVKAPGSLSVTLNGEALAAPAQAKHWLAYPVKPEIIVQGMNTLVFSLEENIEEAITVKDMVVLVRY